MGDTEIGMERQRCPLRVRGVSWDGSWDEPLLCPSVAGGTEALPDGWRIEPNGERSCSYCGSMHPDDLMAFLNSVDGVSRWIDLNDNKHKVYIHRPEVESAKEGPIKYYIIHSESRAVITAINMALVVTKARDKERMAKQLTSPRWRKLLGE